MTFNRSAHLSTRAGRFGSYFVRHGEASLGVALALFVVGPWLVPGFLFGTDWPGQRRFALPAGISSSAPLEGALAIVSYVCGAEATGKVLGVGTV